MASVANSSFDVGLGLEGTHALITGAAGQIGTVLIKVGEPDYQSITG